MDDRPKHPENDYGTIISDLTRPFFYQVNLSKYEHKSQGLNNNAQILQFNWNDYILPDPDLVDIESDLRRQNTRLSKVPQARFPQRNSKCSKPNDVHSLTKHTDESIIYCPKCLKRITTSSK